MNADYLTSPIDDESRESLARQGLRMDMVDTADRASYENWLKSEARGFYEDQHSPEMLELLVNGLQWRRATGVWDDRIAEPELPVATVDSWSTQLTLPGRTSVESWAISGVTVAPTHRRRGIARGLLEAELRTAHRLGVPVAILTVSESTIYGRFGFSPAALSADWSVDTKRVTWVGPESPGRVQQVQGESLRKHAPEIFERARLESPGEIEIWDLQWDSIFGLRPPERTEAAKKLQFIRYDDAAGVSQGFAVFKVAENETDFTKHTVTVVYLTAATDEAYAGLWRFLLELDLVARVEAGVRSAVEPFVWLLSDYRAVDKTAERDHLWLRILDVRGALEARRFGAAGRFQLEIEDPLGFTAGRFLLDVSADGVGRVSAIEGHAPEDAHTLAMTVRELGSLYLGGVSASNLVRANRIREYRTGDAAALDRTLSSTRVPWQSIWF